MDVAVAVASWVWSAVEIGLRVRDRVRGRGGSARDRHTRLLIVAAAVCAVAVSVVVGSVVPPGGPLDLPGRGPATTVVGVALMAAGLALRLWAVVVLGRSFRTTVEIDPGQEVVARGPYRLVRHPAYSGVVLLVLGLGVGAGTWVSLVLCVALPTAALHRRITVEETALAGALGEPYRAYSRRTRRLVPGLW
jgi:protein-S-isoprenylcysteine O-methyltransferase Ste14